MRKIAFAIAAAILAVSLCGCAKSISGSVESCIEQAQELGVEGKATVTVTGKVDPIMSVKPDGGEDSLALIVLCDSDNNMAWCYFRGMTESQFNEVDSGRVTITGDIQSEYTSDDCIHVMDCKVA